MEPGAVLVMVFHCQDDILFFGVLEAPLYALKGARHSFFPGHARVILAAECAAAADTQADTEIDRLFLAPHLALPLGPIRMGEVR